MSSVVEPNASATSSTTAKITQSYLGVLLFDRISPYANQASSSSVVTSAFADVELFAFKLQLAAEQAAQSDYIDESVYPEDGMNFRMWLCSIDHNVES